MTDIKEKPVGSPEGKKKTVAFLEIE